MLMTSAASATCHAPVWIALVVQIPLLGNLFPRAMHSPVGGTTMVWEGIVREGRAVRLPGAIHLHLHHLSASGKSEASSGPLIQRLEKVE